MITPIQSRLLSLPGEAEQAILYQHTILCQTCMPYRNPGDGCRIWQRKNGIVRLEIAAGRVLDPGTGEFRDVGLPYGPKPRLVLFHANAEALRTQNPVVHLDDSLSAFVRRTLGNTGINGRAFNTFRDQLTRLAAADFRLGAASQGKAVTIKGTVIEGLELWTPDDPRQRVLWPSTIQFSARYFDSLLRHAVPLSESAVKRLSHNSMALDIYTWLAQRLHRVDQPAFIPWPALQQQFGDGYDRLWDFKRVLTRTLTQVRVVYPDARLSLDGRGMELRHSAPPVAKKYVALGR